ncbi:hypothetical protein BT63DRAFT_482190 [Microthyrium microscopicum]|uniref:cAMP-dependent protein kinase n=1 Tax=Microthyrium microscopicum TaxID=703497 RepID=A0A6A6U662_9PEZI|nr:hypothetical protein BT63DRAFT_482190 [Microthyrium microscopicum]
MTEDEIDFVQKLLRRVSEGRLGSAKNGAEQVMAHSLFNGMDWKALYDKKLPAPIIPVVGSRTDFQHLDDGFTGLKPPAILDNSENIETRTHQIFWDFDFSAE